MSQQGAGLTCGSVHIPWDRDSGVPLQVLLLGTVILY